MSRRHIYPTLPGEVAGRTGDMNAEINRRESQFARMPAGFVASKRLSTAVTPAGDVPLGSIVIANLNAAAQAQFFDSTGKGIAGKTWADWAICNGNNGTPKFPNFLTIFPGMVPVIRIV